MQSAYSSSSGLPPITLFHLLIQLLFPLSSSLLHYLRHYSPLFHILRPLHLLVLSFLRVSMCHILLFGSLSHSFLPYYATVLVPFLLSLPSLLFPASLLIPPSTCSARSILSN